MNPKKHKVLAIIPARGGSKGVPRKNIREIAGKPLVAWTIETALSCDRLDRVMVSTEDKEIAEIAKRYGAEIPFSRPLNIAQDDTPDLPVYRHALSWLKEHEKYCPDIIVWLRPTAPLRIVEDIEGAIELLTETKADWVRTVCMVEHHPFWMKTLDGNRLLPFAAGIRDDRYNRRQLLPPVYRLNGAVDATWRETIEKELFYSGDVRGYVMPTERSIDLDNETDFSIAELLMGRTR